MSEILVVDDERQIREKFRRLLRLEGYSVHTANNGAEALEALAERPADLVLLDVMMPVRNGFAFCETVRRENPLLPIVFLTALDDPVNEVRGLDVGADDYLSKSDSDAVVLAAVRRALARVEAIRGVSGDVLRLGHATVDFARGCFAEDGREVARLSLGELGILRLLGSERGRYFSVDELFAATKGPGYIGDDRAMRTQISRLKSKLGKAGELVVNTRGCGYALLK